MKRKLIVSLGIMAICVMMLSVMSFGAFDGYALRFNNQEILDGLIKVHTTAELKDGYTSFTSTAHDPNITYEFSDDDVLDADVYKYAVIRYKTTYKQDGLIGELFFTSETAGPGPDTRIIYSLNSEDEWTNQVINYGEKAAWAGEIKSLRIDYLQADNLPADATMDIEYIAFFETEAEANAFDGNFDGADENPPTFDSSVMFVFVALIALGGVVLKKRLAY